MFKAASYVGHKLCRPGDLVVNTMWAWMGALGIAKQNGLVSPSYAVYRLRDNTEFMPDYLDYLLRIGPYRSEYTRRSTGIRPSRLRLYPEQFLQIPLIQPPSSEQKQIVDQIHEKTRESDSAISLIKREIDLVSEYRMSLISNVTTGNLDIRDAALSYTEEPVIPRTSRSAASQNKPRIGTDSRNDLDRNRIGNV
jgi:type I restriction enzyme S subunit